MTEIAPIPKINPLLSKLHRMMKQSNQDLLTIEINLQYVYYDHKIAESHDLTLYVKEFDLVNLSVADNPHYVLKDLVLSADFVPLNLETTELYDQFMSFYNTYKEGEAVLSKLIRKCLEDCLYEQAEIAISSTDVGFTECTSFLYSPRNYTVFLNDPCTKDYNKQVKGYYFLEYRYNGNSFVVCGAEYTPGVKNTSLKLYSTLGKVQPFRFSETLGMGKFILSESMIQDQVGSLNIGKLQDVLHQPNWFVVPVVQALDISEDSYNIKDVFS